jgi:heme exporter protein D
MHWNSLEEFFEMGGYAFFVWSSLGVTVVAMLTELWVVHSQRKQLKLDFLNDSNENGSI